MDKSKWEVNNKTFGEVFDLFMGRTPSRDNDLYWQNGKYEWLSIGDMGDTKYLSKTKEKVSEEAIVNMQLVPENTVVMSFKLSIGKVGITSIPLYTNEAIMAFPPQKGYHILPTYLYYYLQAYKWQPANRAVMGKTLNKSVISGAKISIPPVEDQQRIVAELDCLNEMIALKQEQLKEFDKLAQSIFYDMFGDSNGFEKVKLGDVVEVVSGLVDPNIEPYCSQLHVSPANIISGTNEIVNCVQAKDEGLISDKYPFKAGMVLYSKIRPNLNKVAVAKFDGICSADMYPLSVLPKANNIYITKLMSSKHFLEYAIKNSGRARMPKLNRETLFSYSFKLPPLELQQQFADKISAIEAQKELVKQSIAETQSLFDSRMDYYFN